MKYSVILIQKEMGEGQRIPYGGSRSVTVQGVDNRTVATRKALAVAGPGWRVLSARWDYGQADPDAR